MVETQLFAIPGWVNIGHVFTGEGASYWLGCFPEAVTCLARVSPFLSPAPKLQKSKHPGHVSKFQFHKLKTHFRSQEAKETFILLTP